MLCKGSRCPRRGREKSECLKKDLESLQRAKENLFLPPPDAWVSTRISEVKRILEKKTEQSALLLSSYFGTLNAYGPGYRKALLPSSQQGKDLRTLREFGP